MRTVVLVAVALAVGTPLAAQVRDTTVTVRERGVGAAREVRLKKTQEADRVQAREALTTERALERAAVAQRRVGRELIEMRPLLEKEVAGHMVELSAERARLHELRPTLEAQGVKLREMQPLLESRMRQGEALMASRARGLNAELRALEAMHPIAERPRLGITVALEARATDKYGAYVNGVTPGGPAHKAGIRAGDVIRKIGKVDLTDRDGVRRSESESAPGLKLIETVGKLEAGQTVDVQYRRGTKDRTVKVTLDEADDVLAYTLRADSMVWRRGAEGNLMMRVPSPLAQMDSMRRISRAPSAAIAGGMGGTTVFGVPNGTARSYYFTTGGPLGRFEMTALNPSLGSYFGTSEGVLVINAPENDNLGIMAGDVITAVDGRKVTTPSQLMRIVSTYERTEEMKLQLMRQKRSESVSVKLP